MSAAVGQRHKICFSITLSVSLSIYKYIHQFICHSIYQSTNLSIFLSINHYSIAADPGAGIGLVVHWVLNCVFVVWEATVLPFSNLVISF